jgi:hypothetical protein
MRARPSSRWGLRDELSLVARYLLLGALAGLVGEAGIRMAYGEAAVQGTLAALALVVAGSWAMLALWRGGRGWEAALLFAVATLAGMAAFSTDRLPLLLLTPLPWLGLRAVRFPGRAALAVLHAACVGALVHPYFLGDDNPLAEGLVLSVLAGAFLAWWHPFEETEPRRRAVRAAGLAVGGVAAGTILLGLGLFADAPVLPFLFTVPAALLAPRLTRLLRPRRAVRPSP